MTSSFICYNYYATLQNVTTVTTNLLLQPIYYYNQSNIITNLLLQPFYYYNQSTIKTNTDFLCSNLLFFFASITVA